MNIAEKERIADNRELVNLRKELRGANKSERPAITRRIEELKFKLKHPGRYRRGEFAKLQK